MDGDGWQGGRSKIFLRNKILAGLTPAFYFYRIAGTIVCGFFPNTLKFMAVDTK